MESKVGGGTGLTGESVSVQPERAGFSDRFFAFIVDSIILFVVLKLTQVLFSLLLSVSQKCFGHELNIVLNRAAPFVLYTIFIVLTLAYFAVYAYKNNGQTLGKKWNGIKVADLAGKDLTLNRFLFRELVARGLTVFGFLSHFGFSPTPWHLSYLPALGKNKRALHDYIAKTIVVKVKQPAGESLENKGSNENKQAL